MLLKKRLLLLTALGSSLATGLVLEEAAFAQAPIDKSLEVQLFQNAIGPRNFLTIDSARVPEHMLVGAGLVLNYQSSPFSLYTVDSDKNLTERVSVVGQQWNAELLAGIGLFGRAQIGFALPVTLSMQGDNFTGMGTPSGTSIKGAGMGDLRVEGKYLVAQRPVGEDGVDGDIYFAAVGGLTLPTGDDGKFLGDKTVTGRVKLVSEYVIDDFRGAAMFGVLLRDTTKTFKAEVGHQLMFGAAAEYRVHRQVAFVGEWFGRNGFSNYVDESPMEVDGAVRLNVSSMLALTFGAGTGIIKGIGSPKYRGFLGASFHPDFRDADGDGVYDIDDRCPDSKEDRDGFKDSDGCPEPDNDGDALLDAQDKCPNAAEDVDQFEDEDGCPEEDNDKDGVPDLNDPCPNAAEDGAGIRPKDGCPSTVEDTDGDGVVDAKDKCADEPEDRDGFEDTDGCPDLDNDEDGIPDQFDGCPSAAEDADGFEDEDGCPELDNDKDGLPDASDKCPSEPETLNGNKDDDGCTDPGAELVVIADANIELRERFAFKGTELRPGGPDLVKMVGLVLSGHPEFTLVRLEVIAGTEAEAKGRGEAIKNALAATGVDGARLKVVAKVGRADVKIVVETVTPASEAAPAAADGATP